MSYIATADSDFSLLSSVCDAVGAFGFFLFVTGIAFWFLRQFNIYRRVMLLIPSVLGFISSILFGLTMTLILLQEQQPSFTLGFHSYAILEILGNFLFLLYFLFSLSLLAISIYDLIRYKKQSASI